MATRDRLLNFTESDERPVRQVTLVGVGDITGWTVNLHMDRPVAGPLSIPGVITDGPNGVVEFSFGPTDIEPGKYRAQIYTVDLAGKPQRLPVGDERLIVNAKTKIL